MQNTGPIPDPKTYMCRTAPEAPVMFFHPETLQRTARQFQDGFAGLVTYAVKANPRAEVLENLVAAGITTFDVASVAEMEAVRAICPAAVLHYNNPVRSPQEVRQARAMNCASYSVDSHEELDKLSALKDVEISVRLALPVAGGAYDFGAKFGASPDLAAQLLQRVHAMGATPAMTFHPGTQCSDAGAWAEYIRACARIAQTAGVRLARLNVGGGFAAHRSGDAPNLKAVFDQIARQTRAAFGDHMPALVCEPGRAMVAEAYALATRVKAIRADGTVFLNDGTYGALAELRDIDLPGRVQVFGIDGAPRCAPNQPRIVFGPTCDSIDRLPDPLPLPGDLAPGDVVLFAAMGAYSLCIATRFNGYGPGDPVTVSRL